MVNCLQTEEESDAMKMADAVVVGVWKANSIENLKSHFTTQKFILFSMENPIYYPEVFSKFLFLTKILVFTTLFLDPEILANFDYNMVI